MDVGCTMAQPSLREAIEIETWEHLNHPYSIQTLNKKKTKCTHMPLRSPPQNHKQGGYLEHVEPSTAEMINKQPKPWMDNIPLGG